MFKACAVALLLVAIEVRALGPVPCTPDAYSPDVWPACDTFYSEGERKCVVQYDVCAPSMGCPLELIKWWSPGTSPLGNSVKEGCSEIAYDDGIPTCLAVDSNPGSGAPRPPCVHVWDDGAPRCLTDICGQPIPFCAAKGYCPGTGAETLFSSITGICGQPIPFRAAEGRCPGTAQDGVPHCDDLTTPCQQHGVSPVLARCSNMPPPAGTVSPVITCSSVGAPASITTLAASSDTMIDLETGATMDYDSWSAASGATLARQFGVELWNIMSTWYLYSSGFVAPMGGLPLPNLVIGVATPLDVLTCGDIMGATGPAGMVPSPNMGIDFRQPSMSYIVKTADDNVYALSWYEGVQAADGSLSLQWALESRICRQVHSLLLEVVLSCLRSGMSYVVKTANGNAYALSWDEVAQAADGSLSLQWALRDIITKIFSDTGRDSKHMASSWQLYASALAAAVKPHGLDLSASLRCEWYNSLVKPPMHLAVGSNGGVSLAVLLGNSVAFWPPLLATLREKKWQPDDAAVEPAAAADAANNCCQDLPGERSWGKHPIDAYVMEVVSAAVRELRASDALPAEARAAEVKLYWAHETARGRLVAIQRMAHVSGLAWLHDKTHLCLHPEVGPWLALRAVVLVDVPGPSGPPPPAMPCPASEAEVARAAAAMDAALVVTYYAYPCCRCCVAPDVIKRSGATSREAREAFLAARAAFDLGAAYRYPADVIEAADSGRHDAAAVRAHRFAQLLYSALRHAPRVQFAAKSRASGRCRQCGHLQ
ncbi:hypothetical protein JKP88DRAFT_251426 [Tribonema minus]|uniref:Uncharacterized protein n=1 Tax=Tribonema minus TaxID=303371 RepID=A0A836CM74_9STRA|nr:hypothetical protein JKP88DRAFT_251426 [Tribonema minus]